jgi:hypothetical protein
VERSPERILASALAAGRIPRSRVKFYKDLADSGVDISYVDAYAAVPGGADVAASTAQDDQDAAEAEAYAALFGDDQHAGRVAASGARPTDDQLYSRIFPGVEAERATADAALAAATSASSSLSEDELMRELFGEEGK